MNDDLIERLNDPHRRLTVSDRQEAAIEIAKLREWQRARLETDDALRALSPPEPTERQIERAVDLAMSWQPSERGLSYAERRREVMGLLVPALRAMPLQDHAPKRLPIFAEGGLGSRLLREAEAYAKDEYVFSPDEGSDHEPTEFEHILFEDMLNGLFSHEPFASILREATDAMVAEERAEGG